MLPGFLRDDNFELMAKERGIPIDELCLVPTFEFFGLPTPAFLEHIKDEEWQVKLEGIAAEVERSLEVAKKQVTYLSHSTIGALEITLT